MLGIWSGIGGVIQERILVSRARWRRLYATKRAKVRFEDDNIDPEDAKSELDAINEAFDIQVSKTMQNLRLSIGVLEVSLLMTGTFLWGFGDLLVR